jgi:hypothetical protein
MISGQEQRSFVFCSENPAKISFVDISAGFWRTLINRLILCCFLMLFLLHGDGFAAGRLESLHAAC